MKVYHSNPRTGNPALCRATVGTCPFGTHVLDPVQVFALNEKVYGDATIPQRWTRAHRPPRQFQA